MAGITFSLVLSGFSLGGSITAFILNLSLFLFKRRKSVNDSGEES